MIAYPEKSSLPTLRGMGGVVAVKFTCACAQCCVQEHEYVGDFPAIRQIFLLVLHPFGVAITPQTLSITNTTYNFPCNCDFWSASMFRELWVP